MCGHPRKGEGSMKPPTLEQVKTKPATPRFRLTASQKDFELIAALLGGIGLSANCEETNDRLKKLFFIIDQLIPTRGVTYSDFFLGAIRTKERGT